MSKHIDELITEIVKIEEMGWILSHRTGNTGIGKTFEDLLDKEEDNLSAPDYYDIEIKTHEVATKSMITLFTKSPSNPSGANTMLRERFGKLDEFGNRILHSTITCGKVTQSKEYKYNFSIKVDDSLERVVILVFNDRNELIDDSVYWSFTSLKKQIDTKLKTIAVIHAESKVEEGKKYYRYNEVDLVTGLSIEGLVDAIKNGAVKVDIRIGAYKTGLKRGKTHDHGTGFRIFMKDLLNYADVERLKK
ncbi:MvaI/BcnI family restriction endonuclease [Erysipelothrix rhusiopathiae]|nr:MvaI/BcnI family restriction endonuclease [Erysipelothrix rhusiopathiae]